jgi:hypothetical protein
LKRFRDGFNGSHAKAIFLPLEVMLIAAAKGLQLAAVDSTSRKDCEEVQFE